MDRRYTFDFLSTNITQDYADAFSKVRKWQRHGQMVVENDLILYKAPRLRVLPPNSQETDRESNETETGTRADSTLLDSS